MKPLRLVDKFLNGITMYTLLVYGLRLLIGIALVFSLLGWLTLPLWPLVASLCALVAATYVTNRLAATIWGVAASNESWLISALILFFLVPPSQSVSPDHLALVALVGVIAMLAKYVLAVRRQHPFNPAAFALVVTGLAGLIPAVWWVGCPLLLPFVLILGLLVVRKLRRFGLFLTFLAVAALTTAAVAIMHGVPVGGALRGALLSSPLIFLGTIMLTEPSTTPPRTWQQLVYGGLVGLLTAGQFRLLGAFVTPEIALVLGNLYAAIVSPKTRYLMRLKATRELAPHIFELIFTPDRRVAFQPGQYLEWTLPHPHTDLRGNRRIFSLASSPTETDIRIAIKQATDRSSSFKTALLSLKPGARLVAGQLGGNFLLPADPARKLVLVAGGIGVTPFRSMLKSLADSGRRRDIILFYLVLDLTEVVFTDVLEAAAKQGVTVIKQTAFLDAAAVKHHIPDFAGRTFYLSGPDGMIRAYRRLLRSLGVPASSIVTDYFSGY